MLKKSAISLFIFAALAGAQSCNSDDDTQIFTEETVAASSVLVSAFSLTADDSVLVNLDTIFFSIDQKNAMIFNADSLPFGTKTSRLIPKITYSTVSVAELTYKRENGTDSVVDYLKNSTDSINFATGDVKFRLVSYDGATERTYTIRVNVHQLKPDSLYWDEAAVRKLPSSLTNPTEQKTVEMNGKFYCLTSEAGEYCLACAENPAEDWTYSTPEFNFTPNVSTLASNASTMFILADNGDLYTSTDAGATWTSTGENWTNVIGGYNERLLGLKSSAEKYYHVTYPATYVVETDADFPVEGFSNPVTFTADWSLTPQLYITGGKTASASLSDATWGYDGSSWYKISKEPMPVALYGTTIVPFQYFIVNSSDWTVDSYPILLAMGGKNADGESTKSIYMSYNQGLNWKKCGQLMQFPEYMPAFYGAQALVCDTEFTVESMSSHWITQASRKLPSWAAPAFPSMSRASKPITSWECPYIYIFGGYDANGHILDTVWKGTFNRLTFKPIQ